MWRLILTCICALCTVAPVSATEEGEPALRSFLQNPTTSRLSSGSGYWELERKRATFGLEGPIRHARICLDRQLQFSSRSVEMLCRNDRLSRVRWSVSVGNSGAFVSFHGTADKEHEGEGTEFVLHIKRGATPRIRLQSSIANKSGIKPFYIYKWRQR